MNYLSHYKKLIKRAHKRNDLEKPYEKHHVIPKSIVNDPKSKILIMKNIGNVLVKLSFNEHFVAHNLLVKIFQKVSSNCYQRMLYAHNRMNNSGKGCYNYFIFRQKFIQTVSDRHKGRFVSKETRELIGSYHKGKIETIETKKRKSESKIGDKNSFFGKKHTEESLIRMRLAKTGKKQSQETINRRVATMKFNKEQRLLNKPI